MVTFLFSFSYLFLDASYDGTISSTSKTCFSVADNTMSGLSVMVGMSVSSAACQGLLSSTSLFSGSGLVLCPVWDSSAPIVWLVQNEKGAYSDIGNSHLQNLSCSLWVLETSLAPGCADTSNDPESWQSWSHAEGDWDTPWQLSCLRDLLQVTLFHLSLEDVIQLCPMAYRLYRELVSLWMLFSKAFVA